MNPLQMLKAATAKPLGVHCVATPELVTVPDKKPETEAEIAAAAELLQSQEKQFMAELSGEEIAGFASVWEDIEETIEDESETNMEYKRAAIAFSWCDKDRNRFFTDAAKIREVSKLLRANPATLTYRMYQVANGANAFSGIDDNTKKKSKATPDSAMTSAGNGV